MKVTVTNKSSLYMQIYLVLLFIKQRRVSSEHNFVIKMTSINICLSGLLNIYNFIKLESITNNSFGFFRFTL
jgi:hypothetical protein